MQRVQTLSQKLHELSKRAGEPGLIDIDLMMDYTRVIYADLVEMRNRLAFNDALPAKAEQIPMPVATEPPRQPNADIPATAAVASDMATVPAKSTKPSLLHKIGINDTYLFTSELFDNDKEAYEHAIATLDSFDDYILAEQWLHANYSWDMDSLTVQEFMGILEAYYNRP